MMNSLFGEQRAIERRFNPVSREQMIMSIWRVVKPIDSTEPAAGAVTSPAMLKVNVIDPAVISVDWTVDDGTPMVNARHDVRHLHARRRQPHDVGEGLRQRGHGSRCATASSTCPSSVTGNYCHRTAWRNSIQTVMWTFTK